MKHNTPAKRISHAMVQARRVNYIPTAHVAKLLKIDTETLKRYEFGKEDVPEHIIERIFVLGYQMLHFRDVNQNYEHVARIIFKYASYSPKKEKTTTKATEK